MSVKAVIYFTEVPEKYLHKNMGHMIGEKREGAPVAKKKLSMGRRRKGPAQFLY